MSLKGNLQQFSPAQLLRLIHIARKTGTLSVEGGESIQLAFRSGMLIYAATGDERRELPHILWQSGLLTKEQATVIQARASRVSEKRIGRLLVQTGLLDQEAIARSVRQHALDVASELLTWTAGQFRFERNVLPPPDCITISTSLVSLLVEGTHRVTEWARLRKELPDLDIYLRYADQPKLRLQDIKLNIREWRVVAASNARNTVLQIARVNRLSSYQIRDIVSGLLQAGLVEIVQPARALPTAA